MNDYSFLHSDCKIRISYRHNKFFLLTMSIELLRTFLEVAKTRHFGQTADRLYLTQSAISFRIKQLETLMGVALFTRDRHNISLTPAGERLREHAETMLAAWQLALHEVGAPQQTSKISLGCTPNLWDMFLREKLPQWMRLFPESSLCFDIQRSDALEKALATGQLSAVISADQPQSAVFECFKVHTLELILVSHQAVVAFTKLNPQSHVFVDWGGDCNAIQARVFKTLRPRFHTDQGRIAEDILLSHGGSAFLPRQWVNSSLQSRQLFSVPDIESLSHNIYLYYRTPLDSSISQLIEQLRAQIE